MNSKQFEKVCVKRVVGFLVVVLNCQHSHRLCSKASVMWNTLPCSDQLHRL